MKKIIYIERVVVKVNNKDPHLCHEKCIFNGYEENSDKCILFNKSRLEDMNSDMLWVRCKKCFDKEVS